MTERRPLPYPRNTEIPGSTELGAKSREELANGGTNRRHFLGYLIAAPTLVVAAQVGMAVARPQRADAAVPSLPDPSDLFDLGDLQDLAALPTSSLIAIQVNSDGSATFALPRAEVGQGITTLATQLISEELELPIDKITVTLANARPELLFNQLTGGSNSTRSMYTPIRVAAAIAREQLKAAAAKQWGVPASAVTASNGVMTSGRKSATYGSLAAVAAATKLSTVQVKLKDPSEFTVIGVPHGRVDALEAVTGRKQFAMDMDVPGATPTMVRRPPTINGTVKSVSNLAAVKAMPGITDVAVISTGVAVRGATFGQCIDAVDALVVKWGPGSVDGESDATILKKLNKAELPLLVPALPLLTKAIDIRFTFATASNSPLEPNCAIADVRPDSAEIWSSLKVPIVAQGAIAKKVGLPVHAVTCHVVQGGGSFGRHLFADAAIEAAEISHVMGKPVKLMWHRTDDFRHGRTHPMSTSRVRVTYAAGNVLSYEQRHTSVATDFTHGLGDMITALAATLPAGNFVGFSESIFELTQSVPYNFGITTQLLNEAFNYDDFHTGSMRNIYSPNVCAATELMVDQVAKAMHKDPLAFRRSFLRDARLLAVMNKAAEVGGWGRPMPAHTAQGIAVHGEYKSAVACMIEIDCTPATVNRQIPDAVTGPRVTKAVVAVDVGLCVNPTGLQAQMLGGINDGIALALTSSLHIKDGLPLEGSWDNYFYTRQWNTPPDVQVVVMPPTTGKPGGAGELGVAPVLAAVACAYARATNTLPTYFPINHDTLGFTPLPPSVIPVEPTNGLSQAY
ncbi:MAG: molybdopterin cofactor-binding domain-containing protein [Jatrophihabitantaceae bacterium]